MPVVLLTSSLHSALSGGPHCPLPHGLPASIGTLASLALARSRIRKTKESSYFEQNSWAPPWDFEVCARARAATRARSRSLNSCTSCLI
jgi:hypothetical protein